MPSEQELEQERIEYIFTNMQDAICLCSMNGEIIKVNPAAERLFGLDVTRPAIIWDAIPFIEGNDDLMQLFIDGVKNKKRTQSAIVPYVNNAGATFHLHVTLTCESVESGMILIVVHDLPTCSVSIPPLSATPPQKSQTSC